MLPYSRTMPGPIPNPTQNPGPNPDPDPTLQSILNPNPNPDPNPGLTLVTPAWSPQGTSQHLPLPPSEAHTRLGPLAYRQAVLSLVADTGAVTTTIFNYLGLASACPQLHAAFKFAMQRSAKTLAMRSFLPIQAQAQYPQPR